MQAKQATDIAAQWLQDESNTVWDAARLLAAIKSALHRLCDDRPDVLLTPSGLINREDEIDDLATLESEMPVSIGGRFANALAHLVCHYCYLEDADSTANMNLATAHFELYQGAIS